MNNYKIISIAIICIVIGAFAGYSVSISTFRAGNPTLVNLESRSFDASYGPLQLLVTNNNRSALDHLYKTMHDSLKNMNQLYPAASERDKEIIYLSYLEYADLIKQYPSLIREDAELQSMVYSLIQLHEKINSVEI